MDYRSSRQGYSKASRVLGWLIALAYLLHSVVMVQLPRAEKTSGLRDHLRGWHYLVGTLVFVLVAWRLLRWFRDRPVAAPAGISDTAHLWMRAIGLATYVCLLATPVLGLAYGWNEGLPIHLGPFFTVPALMEKTRLGWMFFGYFHSAIGFVLTLLALVALFTGLYVLLRFGKGMVAAFPPGLGLQLYGSALISIYALSTFKAPEPGRRAIAILLVLTAAFWVLGRWLAQRRSHMPVLRSVGAGPRFATIAAILALVAFGCYMPHLMFRVSPWPVGEVIEAPAGVSSHEKPIVQVTVTPETDFERKVKDETYKWCRFCHTVARGAPPLVGPNLYAIFGQRAGTVPNFYYSKAMAEAGRAGLVWNDDTLDKFIAGPDQFIHGTTMIISSGPVKTPEERRAVINILKKETMPGAISSQ